MTDARDRVIGLLKPCVVKIRGRESVGTGVLIAPGHVLTCAHVAANGPLSVSWSSSTYPAAVRESVPARPGGDIWGYPDLAVLKVDGIGSHPCAWLSDRKLSYDAELVVYGYPSTYEAQGLTLITGRKRGTTEISDDSFIRFSDDEVAKGMSGGPVLDLKTGAVCGLMKSTRMPGTNLGGLVVPLAGMRRLRTELWREIWRSHDRVHVDGPWAGERQALPDLILDPADEVELLGLLARLPVPGDLAAMWRQALYRPSDRPDDAVPLDVRDLVYDLGDLSLRQGELFGPIRLAANLARSSPEPFGQRLHQWAVRAATRMGQKAELADWTLRPTPTDENEPTIVVQLEPDALQPRVYAVTMWVHEGNRTTKVHVDDLETYSISEARATVQRHISAHLKRLHGRGTVEFVLPAELFEENFEELTTGKRSRLGRTNPVVIRDLERLQDPETWNDWHQRWKRLRSGASSTEWLDCAYRNDADQLDGHIRARDEIGVVALTQGLSEATTEALGVALYAGVPAAVWRRGTCTADHGAGTATESCAGRRFRDHLELHRSASTPEPLPQLVKRLRNNAAAEPEQIEFRDIVLLWDNPERLPEPFVPLTEPSGW